MAEVLIIRKLKSRRVTTILPDSHLRKLRHFHVNFVAILATPTLKSTKFSVPALIKVPCLREEFRDLGEDVEMQVNENNAVIDVHRKGDKAHSHRFVTGNLAYTAPDRREIKVWTPEGEKAIDVQTGRSKLSALEEGAPVTVELNEAGKMIDINRFTVEMSFDEHPRTKPGYVIQVNGTVTKIQSGLVYVKTPAGQYTISANTAPADAAVGDDVSLWINEEGMVIDHHGKDKHKAGSHRLIFGKLIYAGTTKNVIKLATPEGVKEFPLERMEVKTKPIAEGSHIVVELNEEGTVIDLRKAQ